MKITVVNEVHIGVVYPIDFMIGPGLQSSSSHTCSMEFMTGDKAGQGKH